MKSTDARNYNDLSVWKSSPGKACKTASSNFQVNCLAQYFPPKFLNGAGTSLEHECLWLHVSGDHKLHENFMGVFAINMNRPSESRKSSVIQSFWAVLYVRDYHYSRQYMNFTNLSQIQNTITKHNASGINILHCIYVHLSTQDARNVHNTKLLPRIALVIFEAKF